MKTMEIALYTENSVFLKQFIRSLQHQMEDCGIMPGIRTFQDPRVLEDRLAGECHFDLLFLDMDSFKTGLRIADFAGRLPASPLLILLTSSEKISSQFLRLQPFRILRKVSFLKDLEECLQAILRDVPNVVRIPYVILDSQGSLYKINLNHIRYIESVNKYLHIIMEDTTLTLRYSINDMDELLQYHHFLRIHKSCIVNAHFVFRIDSSHVIMDDGLSLPLSRYRALNVKEQFQEIFQWNIL